MSFNHYYRNFLEYSLYSVILIYCILFNILTLYYPIILILLNFILLFILIINLYYNIISYYIYIKKNKMNAIVNM